MKAQVKVYEGRMSAETGRRLQNMSEIGKIHSVFRQTFNIVFNVQLPNLLTIGNSLVDGAPNSISVPQFQQLLASLSENDSCLILPDKIYLDTHSIIDLHVSQPNLEKFSDHTGVVELGGLRQNIKLLQVRLQIHNLYLNNPAYLPFFKQVIVEGDSLIEAVVSGNWELVKFHGRRLIGLGVGLTPTGDDYLTGLLLSLGKGTLLKQEIGKVIFGGNSSPLNQTNVISQHQLFFAMGGEGKASVLNLVNGMKQGVIDEVNLQAMVDEVRQIGSTSGFDLLLGILAGLTILVRSEEKNEWKT